VLFGIGLSIPIVICGSSLLARLMDRFPWIVWLGGGVLGWVAGELVISDTLVRGSIGSWDALLHWTLPSLLAFTMAASGWAMAYRASRLTGNTRCTRKIGEGIDETLRKNT